MSDRERRLFGIILLFALTLRVAAAFYLGDTVSGLSGAQDEVSYSMLGHRFAEGYGLTFPERWYPWIEADAPQSYFSASMSLLLGAIYSLFGYEPLIARLIFALMGTAVVGMIYLLARRLFDMQVAALAGLISAAYAYLVFYSVTLVTETPFILSLLSAIYLAYGLRQASRWSRWFLLGIALAVTLLFRMAVIFYLPVLLAWIVHAQRGYRWHLAIPLVVIGLAVAPFTYVNYQKWGRFLLLEAQFGHVFWNGNHPGHDWDFHPYEVFPIPAEVLKSRNDVEINSTLLRMGIRNVIDNPLHFVALTVTRLREFFTFWPTADSSRLANVLRVVSFGAIVPFVLFGIWRSLPSWTDLIPVYLFFVMHTSVYAMTWTMIRYRIPMDALFIIFAAFGLRAVLRRIKRDAWLDALTFELRAS